MPRRHVNIKREPKTVRLSYLHPPYLGYLRSVIQLHCCDIAWLCFSAHAGTPNHFHSVLNDSQAELGWKDNGCAIDSPSAWGPFCCLPDTVGQSPPITMETSPQCRAHSSYSCFHTCYNFQRIRRASMDEKRKSRESASAASATKKLGFARQGWIKDHLYTI